MGTIFANVTGWLKQPYNSNMSAGGWALFVLLLIVLLTFWGMVARTIEAE